MAEKPAGAFRSLRRAAASSAVELLEKDLLEPIADRAEAEHLRELLIGDPTIAALLARLVSHSPFLRKLLRRFPQLAAETLSGRAEDRFEALVEACAALPGSIERLDAAVQPLRMIRGQVALIVALMDCSGRWDLGAVTRALTRFADAAVASAFEIALAKSVASGRWREIGPGPIAPRSGMVILAMGKHGAGELNYSSDIDLIVLFDPERLPVLEKFEPLDVAVRIVQDMLGLLDREDADGRVFRVDLRLRPDPGSTPIATPLGMAFAYYETIGQNWERAALIKARPVAGDLELGTAFLRDLQPFIWRKYFDYAAMADIHAMKRQIQSHRGDFGLAIEGHDVKLGRGGIREIEFFVQTQQLIYGGRRPQLRGRETLAMLEALEADGWASARAVTDLSAAYRFLRQVEHRLQMIADEQTQRLPRDPAELDRFARFLGLTPAQFRKTLAGHLRRVADHYAALFQDAEEEKQQPGLLVFTGETVPSETIAAIGRLGFPDPKRVAAVVRGWHLGHRQALRSPRAIEVLGEMVPMLLSAFAGTSDPEGALLAFDDALGRMPAAVELFAILKQRSALLTLFAELLGSAPRLAEIIAKRPHVLDFLLDPQFAARPEAEASAARIEASLSRAPDFESFLNQARELAYAERFLIGARVVSHLMDPIEAGPAHTIVAEAFIRQAARHVLDELSLRYGRLDSGRVAVLGFGKLGSREMTASSDLDLVILYEAPDDAVSAGPRGLAATEYYSRFTQRLITALSAPTTRGVLYDIDLRLRPSGRKGPVATSLQGFKAYHAREAETWEHMALTRVRAVAGDPAFCQEADRCIEGIVETPRDRTSLSAEVLAMRKLIASEKGEASPWDLKQARGGLVDLEFIAQFLRLAHGARLSAALADRTNTGAILEAATRTELLTLADGRVLSETWMLQSRLSQWLSISLNEAFDPERAKPALRSRLATALALPDFRVLDRQLKDSQRAVRALFERLIA